MPDETPAALIDLDDAASALGIPSMSARTYLDAHGEAPVATYHGKPLWLSDAIHELVAGACA